MKNEQVEVFAAFLRWAYDSNLEPQQGSFAASTDRRAKNSILTYLVNLYIFADRRNVPRLCDEIMSQLIDLQESGFPYATNYARIEIAYNQLPASSALCHAVIVPRPSLSIHPDPEVEGPAVAGVPLAS